jgi:trk system potassium uptake protein TrkA
VHAVVIGCGRVGSAVSMRLADEGWSVGVIDESAEAFNRLDASFGGETFEGHALDIDLLRLAGIERADACVVSTHGDNTNLLCAQIVQRKFGIHCTVVRVLDPARAELYAELGLRTVCPTSGAIDVLTDAVRSCQVAS